jgi:ATP-dependent RNA helicase MSS116
MSEVQKRVLALMPELAGGKPKNSAEAEMEGQEGDEVIQTNIAGKKVSTAARGKHDLLVKAKTGTGKTIVRVMCDLDVRLADM